MLTAQLLKLRQGYGSDAATLLAGRGIQLMNALGWSIVLLRRFGLSTVGTFAVGIVAVTVLSTISPLGLPSFLPRVRQPHARLCFAGLFLQLAALPITLVAIAAYAALTGQGETERQIIFLVALSGYFVGLSNNGLMLSIMAKRFYPAMLAPLVESAAIILAGIGRPSPEMVAGYLLIARAMGAILIWSGMRIELMSFRRMIYVLRRSLGYMAPDAIAMSSEQVAPLFLQLVTTRSELGLFRLCQQMLNATDTPGWSLVQSRYPELVQFGRTSVESLHRVVSRLAVAASVVLMIGSAILAVWIYRLPELIPMMFILSISVLWRYKNNLFEQSLRAGGFVRTSVVLGAAKLLIGAVVFYVMIHWLTVWGAVLSLASLSIGAGFVYERVYGRQVRSMRVPV